MNLRRILMNAADASPGSGTASTDAAQSDTQAQGAGASSTVDIAAIVTEAVSKAVASATEQTRNSIFAEMRRTGQIEKSKPAKTEPTADKGAPAQPDLSRLRMLDRALAKTPYAARLNDKQYARLERDFVSESPDDAATWLSDYFGDLGTAAAPAAAGTTAPEPAAPSPRTSPPASDGGAPAPSRVPLAERRVQDMTASDRAHLIKEKGLSFYKSKVFAELQGQSVRLK